MMSIKLAFLTENSTFVAKAVSECDFSEALERDFSIFIIENGKYLQADGKA